MERYIENRYFRLKHSYSIFNMQYLLPVDNYTGIVLYKHNGETLQLSITRLPSGDGNRADRQNQKRIVRFLRLSMYSCMKHDTGIDCSGGSIFP